MDGRHVGWASRTQPGVATASGGTETDGARVARVAGSTPEGRDSRLPALTRRTTRTRSARAPQARRSCRINGFALFRSSFTQQRISKGLPRRSRRGAGSVRKEKRPPEFRLQRPSVCSNRTDLRQHVVESLSDQKPEARAAHSVLLVIPLASMKASSLRESDLTTANTAMADSTISVACAEFTFAN